jgi:serine/threonine protein kinase
MSRRLAGRFELVRKLGEGVTAEVFRARDLERDEDVAIKLLRPASARDATAVERLRREILAVAAIKSPHVVARCELHVADGDVFIAMDHVAGPTLRDLLGSVRWTRDAIHVVVGQIAHVIAIAHERSVLHRDIKPENILLPRTPGGRRVKVLDFGLAKLAELERQDVISVLTETGQSFGTPQYMAPEQLEGGAASNASDLWALAVVAFELVAGKLPWDASDARDIFFAVSTYPPPKLDSAIERHTALDRFFANALARDPAQRPASAAELFAAFEQAMFGGPRATENVFEGVVGVDFAVGLAIAEASADDPATGETLLGAETAPGAETQPGRATPRSITPRSRS